MATASTKGKHHCERHGVWYGALEQCGQCDADPGPAPDDEIASAPVDFPSGISTPDDQLRGWEDDLSDLVSLRQSIYSKAHREVDGVVLDAHMLNTYAKIQDGISKIRRSLIDAGLKRIDEVEVNRREKRLVKSARGAAH